MFVNKYLRYKGNVRQQQTNKHGVREMRWPHGFNDGKFNTVVVITLRWTRNPSRVEKNYS